MLTERSEVLQNIVQFHGDIYPVGIARKPIDTTVIFTNGGDLGIMEGKLSGISSYSKPPGSKTLQEVWTVTCTDGNFCRYFTIL